MANEKPPQINEEGKEDKIKAIISVDNKDQKDPHRLKKMVTFLPEELDKPGE